MQLPTSLLISAAALGLSGVTEAVCANNTYAVGNGTVSGDNTVWNVYDTSCNVYTTYSQPSTVSVCDSSDFYCTFGTTEIDQFDDPTTGWAYNCTADAVEESCAGNLIIDCCFPFWGQIPDADPEES